MPARVIPVPAHIVGWPLELEAWTRFEVDPSHGGMTSVRGARDVYLDANGFSVASYTERWAYASVLGMKIPVLNTRARKVAIALHDLHHVATGFGTDFVGEGEISAWEAGAGLPKSPYVSAIILSGFFVGVLMAPRRAFRALQAGRRARSLFRDDGPGYEALLRLSVTELRARLAIAAEGLAVVPPRLHSAAPARAPV